MPHPKPDEEGSPPTASPGPGPLVQAQNLGYRFPDRVWAFRGIDFSLEAGRIALLAGRNGAGKTLFAKHLAGLLEPSEGQVLVSGQDLRRVEGSRARLVGYVFQDARMQIVGDRVFEDLLFGPTNLGLDQGLAHARAESALKACGLEQLRESFVHRLSGGELRRLAIAGVIATGPRALILDEPFANLDLEGVGSVLRIVRDLAASGTAVLLVTHEIEKVLGMVSSFAVMDRGRLVLSGSPSEVLSRGIESFGLRDPLRRLGSLKDLTWLD